MNLDIKGVFEQIKKVQSEMENIKNELSRKIVVGEAGGGMVKAEMNGNNQLRKVIIADELIAANDKSMIEDLVVAAVNKAYQEASELSKNEMGKLKGLVPNIPGLNLNL